MALSTRSDSSLKNIIIKYDYQFINLSIIIRVNRDTAKFYINEYIYIKKILSL